jgi:hypothetical protein
MSNGAPHAKRRPGLWVKWHEAKRVPMPEGGTRLLGWDPSDSTMALFTVVGVESGRQQIAGINCKLPPYFNLVFWAHAPAPPEPQP